MDNDCWKQIQAVLGKTRRVLLHGPPGTGKTYSAVKQTAPLNADGTPNVYQITMTEDTASANLEGFYKPSSTGTFEWHDGIAIQAWRNGGLEVCLWSRVSGPISASLKALCFPSRSEY